MKDKRFWIPLYTIVFAETLAWIWSLVLFSDQVSIDHPLFKIKEMSSLQYIVFLLIMSYYTGLNAIAGHELLHRREQYNRIVGCFAYTKFLYSHFLNEHVDGHHRNVGTPLDPATSKQGETVYYCILKSYFGSHITTWNREVRRIKRKQGENSSFILHVLLNVMTFYFLVHAAILGLIYYFLGWQSLKHQLWYSAAGVFYLELVNYVEHYGLERKKDEDGVYETVNFMHSWNSLSSPFHIRLQRHSDHHAKAYRPYQILKKIDEAPYLPFEYLHCLVLVLFPPLWFYLVDPRVNALKAAEKGIKSEVRFNLVTPKTAKDKWLEFVGYSFLALFQGVCTYFTFIQPVYLF